MTNLSALSLAGTAVTDAGMANLKRLTKLTDLDLRNTAVSNDAMKDLQQEVSGLQIMGMTY